MTAGAGMTARFGMPALRVTAFGMTAFAAVAATRRPHVIVPAPTAIVVAAGFVIAADVTATVVAVVSHPADADGARCKHRESRTGDDSGLPRRREMAHFSSASS
jgi:hypothetical protein